jgi:hypothetical protein
MSTFLARCVPDFALFLVMGRQFLHWLPTQPFSELTGLSWDLEQCMDALGEGLVVFCPWQCSVSSSDTEDNSVGSDVELDQRSVSAFDSKGSVVRA